MTKTDQPPLTEAQLDIMDVIWELGEATVADVWRGVSARRPVARNTVLTMITRLEEKGWLRHRAVGNAFRYTALLSREAAQQGLLRRLLNTAFKGSAEGLVMALLEDRSLTRDESERIRTILSNYKRSNRESES